MVIPAYNHESYIAEAIESVLAQDWPNLALSILDDGSTDGTVAAAEVALGQAGGVDCRLDRQSNAGAAVTLNRLIERSDADLVAILNSDDRYMPGRLRAMAAAVREGDVLAFSGVDFDSLALVGPQNTFENWYRGKVAYAMSLPTCGFSLVTANLAISSSNFLFSRGLFDRVRGFNPELPLTHDWEFLLKALRWTEPHFVPQRLLYYRTHATNTFRSLVDIRIDQSQRALAAYVAWAVESAANPLAPTPGCWPRFFQVFARSCTPAFSSDPVGRFLPESMMAASKGSDRTARVDQAALANLLAGARRREDNLRLSTPELLAAAADFWSGVRRDVISHG